MPVTVENLISKGGPTQNLKSFGELVTNLAYELWQNDQISEQYRNQITEAAAALSSLVDNYAGKRLADLDAEQRREYQRTLDKASELGTLLSRRDEQERTVFDKMLSRYGEAERSIVSGHMRAVDEALDLGIVREMQTTAANTRNTLDSINYRDFLGHRLGSSSGRVTEGIVKRAGINVDDLIGEKGTSRDLQLKNTFLLYLLSEENMSVEDLKNLGNLSASERRAIGDRFLNDLNNHPIASPGIDDPAVPQAQKEQSAAWYGRMTKRAVDKLKEGYRFPSTADLRDPEAIRRMNKSNAQLTGHIGSHFDELTAGWRGGALESKFAEAFGGMQGLQNDRNAMMAAGAVHWGSGLGRFGRNDAQRDTARSMTGEFLQGLEEKPIDAVNLGGNAFKGDRACRNIHSVLRGTNRALLDEEAIRDNHMHVAGELFKDAVKSLDLTDLEPYIDEPDFAKLSPEALDKAVELFDREFGDLAAKEKNVTDAASNRFDKSITSNFLIVDSSDEVRGTQRVSVSSMVDHLLEGQDISREQKAKYEKAYILHMLAEQQTNADVKLEYHPFDLKIKGSLNEPSFTASSDAHGYTWERMDRISRENVESHFKNLQSTKQAQLEEQDKEELESNKDSLTSAKRSNGALASHLKNLRTHGIQYDGPGFQDIGILEAGLQQNFEQNHEKRTQRMGEEIEFARNEYRAQEERRKQHDLKRRENAHTLAGRIRDGEEADPLLFDRETKEQWKREAENRQAAKSHELDVRYALSEPDKNLGFVNPAPARIPNDQYQEKINREVYRPLKGEPVTNDLRDLLSPSRRALIRSDVKDSLTSLQEMFGTRKRGGFFNRNSDEYDAAKADVDTFMQRRNEMAEYISRHAKYVRSVDNYVIDELQEKLSELNKAERKMQDSLSKYIRKVTKGNDLTAGSKGIENMTQDAGAARLSGAVSILETLKQLGSSKGFDKLLGNEKVDVNTYHGAVGEGENAHYSDREMEIIARQAAKMEKKRPGQGYDHPEQLPDEKKNELLNINAERQAENKSHITSYAELFEKNHSEAKEAGAKDADRKAAQRAQRISNLRIAGENAQKEMKNAQKEINRDRGLR